MKIFLWVLCCITAYIYASQSELEIETIPHVVSFSFPKEQLPGVHSILEKVYALTAQYNSGLLSTTPTGSVFHCCPDNTTELKQLYDHYFMPIAEIFAEQMGRFLKSGTEHLPELNFSKGVPGAYVSAENFLDVCQRPMPIHRDSSYLRTPSEKGNNEFTLIISENFVADQSEFGSREQVFVGTSVYNQHGEKPVHIVAKQSGEITLVVISQHSMHSTSHECIPKDFVTNTNRYFVKRALFQGYFTGPDTDQIDWDKVAKITGTSYSLERYEALKIRLNALYANALKEYQAKIDTHQASTRGNSVDSYRVISRAIEMQFRELQTEEILPTLGDYNIFQYLIAKREMSKFTDAFVAAVNVSIDPMTRLLIVEKTLQNELEDESIAFFKKIEDESGVFLKKIQDTIEAPKKLEYFVELARGRLVHDEKQSFDALIRDFRLHFDYLLKHKKQLEAQTLPQATYYFSRGLQDKFDLE